MWLAQSSCWWVQIWHRLPVHIYQLMVGTNELCDLNRTKLTEYCTKNQSILVQMMFVLVAIVWRIILIILGIFPYSSKNYHDAISVQLPIIPTGD